MFSNMFLQALYQLIVSCIILFRGHLLFYENVDNGNVDNVVKAGSVMLAKQNEVFSDLTDLQKSGEQLKMGWFSGCVPTQHYTMLFNAFVMMTLFNQFASRKLNGESNFFAGIQDNKTFLVLSVVELGLQILFVQAFGAVVGCVPGGLTGGQWLWCCLFGLIGWVWQLGINILMKTFS